MDTNKLEVVAERVSARYLQGGQDRKALSLPDPATTLLFIQIISELVGLLDLCEKPVTSLQEPTTFQKIVIRHSIKSYLGRENAHLTRGVYDAILETGSEFPEKEFLELVDFIKDQKCEK